MTFADKVIEFNRSLSIDISLPESINVMNPFVENPDALDISTRFYKKFYSDNKSRKLILSINPGRLGAGVTGIPFTDTKRLQEHCDLRINNIYTHEPSSEFVYKVIDSYGGTHQFFNDYYINSVCPLGFVKSGTKGKQINFNYYDSKALLRAVKPFIIESIQRLLSIGISTDECLCLGSGENYHFLLEINNDLGFFKKVIPLEHPRYIMQYKRKNMDFYLNKYLNTMKN